jgi:hypothetical protein
MPSNSEGSRASGDAAIILDMQQPSWHSTKDTHTADPTATAAAATANGSDMSSNHVLPADDFAAHSGGVKNEDASRQQLSSIYQVFNRRQRGLILAVVSVSQFLNPFSSSIILPSLKVGGLPLQLLYNMIWCCCYSDMVLLLQRLGCWVTHHDDTY